MKKSVICTLLTCLFAAMPLFGDWVVDQEFKFKINVPASWQRNSFNDGSDRVYAFVSPDQNVAVRIRAFRVNDKVSIDLVASLFKTNILGQSEQLALMDHTVNGCTGKVGAYKGVYEGVQVGAGAFYTIRNGIAYIVWSLAPLHLFQEKAAQSDAVTNTFTIIEDSGHNGSGKPGSGQQPALTNTFRDETLGYRISYPADWVYRKTKPYIVMFSGREGTPAYYTTVNIQNLASTLGGGNFNTTADVVAHFQAQLQAGASNVTSTDPQEFAFQSGGKNITGSVYEIGYYRQNTHFRQMMVIFPRHDQRLFYAFIYTASADDYDTGRPLVIAMLDTWVIE